MNLLVDTGPFSAANDTRRQPNHASEMLVGNRVFLAEATVAELRYGAISAAWGSARRLRLESAIGKATRVPVTDGLVSRVAELRSQCRLIGHPLHEKIHTHDLWIAASAVYLELPIVATDAIFGGVPGLSVLEVNPPLTEARPPLDVGARMTIDSGIHGVPLPDDAKVRPPLPDRDAEADAPPGMTTAVGTMQELADYYKERMVADGWTLDVKHSTFDPWRTAALVFGVFAYYDRAGISVLVAILPSAETSGEHSILITEVTD